VSEKCGCGRPLKHLGRCSFRRKKNEQSPRQRKKRKTLAEIFRRNAEFMNAQGVSLGDDGFVAIASPVDRMTRRQALIHASHLIAVADPNPESQEFIEILGRVVAIYH
jgi:RNA:NAD 2'-phosphotransferase (TPT1/KptA family)